MNLSLITTSWNLFFHSVIFFCACCWISVTATFDGGLLHQVFLLRKMSKLSNTTCGWNLAIFVLYDKSSTQGKYVPLSMDHDVPCMRSIDCSCSCSCIWTQKSVTLMPISIEPKWWNLEVGPNIVRPWKLHSEKKETETKRERKSKPWRRITLLGHKAFVVGLIRSLAITQTMILLTSLTATWFLAPGPWFKNSCYDLCITESLSLSHTY